MFFRLKLFAKDSAPVEHQKGFTFVIVYTFVTHNDFSFKRLYIEFEDGFELGFLLITITVKF